MTMTTKPSNILITVRTLNNGTMGHRADGRRTRMTSTHDMCLPYTLGTKQKPEKKFDKILEFVTSLYDVITVSAYFLLHIKYGSDARLHIGAFIVMICRLVALL